MSASGSCRTSCARSLYVDLLCKISLPRSLHHLCMMTSCPRSLCQDLCIRILQDLFCKISVCGSLVQDLSVMMSTSGSCRTSCARSLYEDLLCKISLSRSLHQDPVGPLVQDLCVMITASGSCRTVGPLVQDLCMRISCPRSLCHDVCIRILQDLLRKISV